MNLSQDESGKIPPKNADKIQDPVWVYHSLFPCIHLTSHLPVWRVCLYICVYPFVHLSNAARLSGAARS